MNFNIYQALFKFIKNFSFLALFFVSCLAKNYAHYELKLNNGKIIKTYIANNDQARSKGLSGVKNNQFQKNEAMLFYFPEVGARKFWMPDTYFNLDIFFLDSNLKVIDIQRNVKHHIGRQNPHTIPTTKIVYSRHVLEMRADSELSKSIKIGDKLIWKSNDELSKIKSSTHPLQ